MLFIFIISYARFHALSMCIMFIEKHAWTIMYIEHYYRKKRDRKRETIYMPYNTLRSLFLAGT